MCYNQFHLSKHWTSSTKLVFSGRWQPWPLIGCFISDLSSAIFNIFWRKLTGSKYSTSSTKFGFPGPIRLWSWPLISLNIFDFSCNFWMDFDKYARKRELNKLYQVCFFGPIRQQRWPPWPLICWHVFGFAATAAQNKTKHYEKKVFLHQHCAFLDDT